MNTDTPETDRACKFWPCEQMELVDADFARKLERERDEAKEALRELWQSADAYIPSLDSDSIRRWRIIAEWNPEQ